MIVIDWLLLNWTGLLAVVLTFGFMIFVHELGHFLMAKRVGITVHEFALGFGPKLLSFGGNKKKKNKGEASGEEDNQTNADADTNTAATQEPVRTEYCLRAVPFGGFVRMEGEDEPGNATDPGNFNNKRVWDRMKVILAGCTMNYIAGFLILIFIGFAWGLPIAESSNPPAIVGNLMEGYPLQQAGLQIGDEILKVDDTEVKDFQHLSNIITPMKGDSEVVLTVKRGDNILNYNVKVRYDEERERGMLGFSPKMSLMNFTFEKKPAGEVLKSSLDTTWNLTIMPYTVARMIIAKKISGTEVVKGTTGPIGIGQLLFEISKKGIPSLMFICAMLSILIGAFNLLPIPALDGSRAMFLAVEGVRKKPIDPSKEGMVHQLGFIVLIILMVIVSLNDILRLIRGENLLK